MSGCIESVRWTLTSQALPDSDTTVNIERESGADETIWLGYHDGERWMSVEGMELVDVIAWAPMLGGLIAGKAIPVSEGVRQQIVADFLHSTGQYVTNDASREAASKAAVDKALAARDNAPSGSNEFPSMTPELAGILGTMCFQCIGIAQTLRAAGHEIKRRAEDEQAAALHWMLGHYFHHGAEGWRSAAAEDMQRMRDKFVAAASITESAPS